MITLIVSAILGALAFGFTYWCYEEELPSKRSDIAIKAGGMVFLISAAAQAIFMS